MIRVVCQHSPSLFSLSIADEKSLVPTFVHEGVTFYRSETHNHYVLYRSAISGWGEAKQLDPRQR